jgi:hypothetical protein
MTTRIGLLVTLLFLASPAAAQEAVAVVEGDATADAASVPSSGGAPLTDRPFFVGGAIGGAFGLNNGGGAAFSLEEDVGYRFFGFTLADNLDGAIWAGLSFGQSFASGFYLLQFDVRGGADLEVFDNGELQLLVTPSLALGAAVVGVSTVLGDSTGGAFDMQISAQAELVLLEGLLGVWLRPLSFEFFINQNVGVNYELLAGALVHL